MENNKRKISLADRDVLLKESVKAFWKRLKESDKTKYDEMRKELKECLGILGRIEIPNHDKH